MGSAKRKIKGRENLALARAGKAAKRRKIEEITEQPLENLSGEENTIEAEKQHVPQECFDSGQAIDTEMINTVINMEATIIPPSDEVAAMEHHSDESNGHDCDMLAQYGPAEPDESILPFRDNMPPEIDANQSHDALVEKYNAVQGSVNTVLSPYTNAKIPHDIAADALQRLDYILYPSKCVSSPVLRSNNQPLKNLLKRRVAKFFSSLNSIVNSTPLSSVGESIRRFFNKSQRYIDAYSHGLDGQMAAWANKKYRGHRMLPPNILREVEAEFQRQRASVTLGSNPVTVEINPV